MKVDITEAVESYSRADRKVRQAALRAVGLRGIVYRELDEIALAGVAFFALGFEEARRLGDRAGAAGQEPATPLEQLQSALAEAMLGLDPQSRGEQITLTPTLDAVLVDVARRFARLDDAARRRAMERIGRQGLAWLEMPAIKDAARVFYGFGFAAPHDGGAGVTKLAEVLKDMQSRPNTTAATASAITIPAGQRVAQDRLDLHQRATARASREGISYVDAVTAEEGAAVAVPAGRRVAQDRLDLHQRATARASREGISYVDAAAMEEAALQAAA